VELVNVITKFMISIPSNKKKCGIVASKRYLNTKNLSKIVKMIFFVSV
jgi:hypothetical protein